MKQTIFPFFSFLLLPFPPPLSVNPNFHDKTNSLKKHVVANGKKMHKISTNFCTFSMINFALTCTCNLINKKKQGNYYKSRAANKAKFLIIKAVTYYIIWVNHLCIFYSSEIWILSLSRYMFAWKLGFADNRRIGPRLFLVYHRRHII